MFIIASSGRCGTMALCNGLHQFSDHQVLHEPPPLLLEEAFLKHSGQPYETPVLKERLAYFQARAEAKYGESFRAPNLLGEIAQAAPQTRFLILVRDPLEYVISAHSMRVFRKDDEFDRTRIVPRELGVAFASLPLAEKIAWHWVAVNNYLLDFAEAGHGTRTVFVVSDLGLQIDAMVSFLSVAVVELVRLSAFLQTRPNAASSHDLPEGYDPERLMTIAGPVWERALALAVGH